MDDVTTKWIKEISRNETSLFVQLVEPEKLDVNVFERMANDDFCVGSVLRNREKGIVMYSIKDLITLDDFLKQYVFEKEEIYIFLEKLFQQAIASNRNKPILLDPNYIFLNEYGDTFYFVSVPISIGEWMLQKERVKNWIQYLYKTIQTKTAFECIGYLVRFMDADEFSLPNLILGLKNIRKIYYTNHFSFLFKQKTSFRLQEPIYPLYRNQHQERVVDTSNTTVLQSSIHKPCLKNESNCFELEKESIHIGRGTNNEIVLNQKEVSSSHALITCNQDRYYIQDLKSSNGTFINHKRIQRKMRLKDGMVITFANIDFTFCE